MGMMAVQMMVRVGRRRRH